MDDEEKAFKRFYIVKDIFPSVLVVSETLFFYQFIYFKLN